MFIPLSVEKQYQQAAAGDLNVLVVGAGIAGVTVAALLRRAGCRPVLIEQAGDASAAGYMLALMPMVDAALDELGVRDAYRAASVPLTRYAVRGHTGRKLREDSMAAIFDRFGDYRGIARGELLDVLSGDGCAVAFDSTVTELHETPDAVEISVVSGGTTHRLAFDLVIIADGIHSTTRELVPGQRPVQIVDTKWGGWVAWAPIDADADLGEELWGAGFFVGTYPVASEIGVFAGGPRAATAAGPGAFITDTAHPENGQPADRPGVDRGRQ